MRSGRLAPRLALAWLFLAVAFAILARPSPARADQPGGHTVPVAVLAFDSEDAEEQADAMTGALRSRVRNSPGWSLVDTTQALAMLTAAFKCPPRPPPACQDQISQQIKVDRYIWGLVSKGPAQGQVTAEVHLYQKGKPDTAIKETYAENLKDPNDDKGLGKVAARILERFGGSALGTIVIRAGGESGEVVVDGEKHVPLEHGTARLEIAAGSHSVEIVPATGASTKRTVLVTAGRETAIEAAGEATPPPPPPGDDKPFPTRKVFGGVLMGIGAVLGAVAIAETVSYGNDKSKGSSVQSVVPGGEEPCQYKPQSSTTPTQQTAEMTFCNANKDAVTHSTLALAFGGGAVVAIGAGAYFFFFGDAGSEKPQARTRVVPILGPNQQGILVTKTF